MGDHSITVHVTGGTDAIKRKAHEFVAELKKIGRVTGATITHGVLDIVAGAGEAIVENRQ